MKNQYNYQDINKSAWNRRTDHHFDSDFYDNKSFIAGRNSLNSIELDLLGDVSKKKVLHLQCHFGQDTISLSRLGAETTGVDLSNRAIEKANILAAQCDSNARFICCDVYDLRSHLNEKFDVIFASYGVIGWLPDMDKWAKLISDYLVDGGQLVFVEFHPVVWMFDDDFSKVAYRYFNSGPIVETNTGTYTDDQAEFELEYINWNHGISEVFTSLVNHGMSIEVLQEFDYSPYDCFKGTVKLEEGKYRIEKLGDKIPMVYAIGAKKI